MGGETINGERYRTQLIHLKRTIAEKRPEYATRHEAIIFHHDNARPHVAIPVKNYLENSGWKVLPHPPYSPDLAPSDYHLFRSMIHSWPPSWRSSFGMESTNCQKDVKKSRIQHFIQFYQKFKLISLKKNFILKNVGNLAQVACVLLELILLRMSVCKESTNYSDIFITFYSKDLLQ